MLSRLRKCSWTSATEGKTNFFKVFPYLSKSLSVCACSLADLDFQLYCFLGRLFPCMECCVQKYICDLSDGCAKEAWPSRGGHRVGFLRLRDLLLLSLKCF